MVIISVKISKKTRAGLKRLKKKDYKSGFKSMKSYCTDIVKDYIYTGKYKNVSVTKKDIIIDKATPFVLEWDEDFYKDFLVVIEEEIRDINPQVHIILTDFVIKRGEFK